MEQQTLNNIEQNTADAAQQLHKLTASYALLQEELKQNRLVCSQLMTYLQQNSRSSVPLPVVIILFLALSFFTIADKIADRNIVIEGKLPGTSFKANGGTWINNN